MLGYLLNAVKGNNLMGQISRSDTTMSPRPAKPADRFPAKIWGLQSLRQHDRLNLDDSSGLLPFHLRTRLLGGEFVENLGNGLIFEIQNIHLLADDQVILGSSLDAGAKARNLIAIHRVLGSADRITDSAREGLRLGGERIRRGQNCTENNPTKADTALERTHDYELSSLLSLRDNLVNHVA